MTNKNYTLTIGWLFPQLMSTYGDRGNILVLQKRCEWRKINALIVPIDETTTNSQLEKVNLLFGGGAQDREQELVIHHLRKREKIITTLIEAGVPALFVCGAPQLFGTFYEPGEGQRIEGLGIFDMYSKHPGIKESRLIGNVIAKVLWENFSDSSGISAPLNQQNDRIIGFENHGGRTYLGTHAKPFAQIEKGNGNNGKDGTEGIIYKNAIGTYLHGPLLPKNPIIADWLIKTAIEKKYETELTLIPLDDNLASLAKKTIVQRLS